MGSLAEPVHMKNAGRLAERTLHIDPMAEIVAHVVTAEGQHSHGIAANFAKGARSRRGHLRSHGGTDVNTRTPVECLVNQRHGRSAAPAEDDRANRHALRIFPCRIYSRAL